MANPTTNYGFVLPTSTDLVTDLPADFDIALQGVDTRLKALQPGTTLGDIAYSSSTANTNTRLPIGSNGQVLAVSGGVPAWTTTADVTPLTTKGDLFTFTTVDARLAVGNNGETLVADSSASTGLRYQSAYNGNAIINGGFDVWQRGTTMTAGGQQYKTADRYYLNNNNNPNFTFNQVASGFDSIRYAARIQRASGSTSTTVCAIGYTLETNDSVRFQGKTVTFSYYVKKGSNFSGADFNGALYYGTGTDQQLYSFTGLTIIGSAFSISPTTSWVRYSYTATVPTTATEIGFQLQFTPTGTAGTNDFIDITGIQLEEGSVATTFKRAGGGTIQGELAACQRYYYRTTVLEAYGPIAYGYGSSGTVGKVGMNTTVTMRTKPSAIDYSAVRCDDSSGINITLTSVTLGFASGNIMTLLCNASSGFTANRPVVLLSDGSTTSYVGLSAEL